MARCRAWAGVVFKSSQVQSGVGKALKAAGWQVPHLHTGGWSGYALLRMPSMERCLCCSPARHQREDMRCSISRWPRRHSSHCSRLGNKGLCGPCSHVRNSKSGKTAVLGRRSGCLCREWGMTGGGSPPRTLASCTFGRHTLWVSAHTIMPQPGKRPKPSSEKGSWWE